MLKSMSAAQFNKWVALDRIEPLNVGAFLQKRLDWITFQLASVNHLLATGLGARDLSITDFLPREGSGVDKTERESDRVDLSKNPRQLYGMVKAWAILNGAKQNVHN